MPKKDIQLLDKTLNHLNLRAIQILKDPTLKKEDKDDLVHSLEAINSRILKAKALNWPESNITRSDLTREIASFKADQRAKQEIEEKKLLIKKIKEENQSNLIKINDLIANLPNSYPPLKALYSHDFIDTLVDRLTTIPKVHHSSVIVEEMNKITSAHDKLILIQKLETLFPGILDDIDKDRIHRCTDKVMMSPAYLENDLNMKKDHLKQVEQIKNKMIEKIRGLSDEAKLSSQQAFDQLLQTEPKIQILDEFAKDEGFFNSKVWLAKLENLLQQ